MQNDIALIFRFFKQRFDQIESARPEKDPKYLES